jgi:hypothetical protein
MTMTQTTTALKAPRARRTPMTAPTQPEQEPQVQDAGPNPPERRVRIPFGTRQQRLDNTPIPGFQAYWVNDIPGRVDRAKRAGYEHVTDEKGSPVKETVGVAPAGGPLIAYRMKLPIEFYNEDMAAKEAPRAQTDREMRQGIKDGGYGSPDRPGFHPQTTVAANLDPATGRQVFNIPPTTGGPASQS